MIFSNGWPRHGFGLLWSPNCGQRETWAGRLAQSEHTANSQNVLPLDHRAQQIQISHGVATQKFPKPVTLMRAGSLLPPSRARRRGVEGHSGTAWPLYFSHKRKTPSRYELGVEVCCLSLGTCGLDGRGVGGHGKPPEPGLMLILLAKRGLSSHATRWCCVN